MTEPEWGVDDTDTGRKWKWRGGLVTHSGIYQVGVRTRENRAQVIHYWRRKLKYRKEETKMDPACGVGLESDESL